MRAAPLHYEDFCLIATRNGRADVLDWAHRVVGCAVSDTVPSEAARRGKIIVTVLVRKLAYLSSDHCHAGYGEVLQWVVSNGIKLDASVCAAAAEGQQMKVLQWLRKQGAPWDWRTGAFMAGWAPLEELITMRQQKCPFSHHAVLAAASVGRCVTLHSLLDEICLSG